MISMEEIDNRYLRYISWINIKSIAFFIVLLLMILLFRKKVFSMTITLLLILAACILPIYKRLIFVSLGFELITFCSVVFAFAFGPLVAVICTLIIVAASSFISWGLDTAMLPKMGVYILMTLLAALLSGFEISLAGKIITVVMNLAFAVIYYFMYGPAQLLSGTLSIVINIIFNFVIFTKYAEPVLGMLK